MTVRADHLTAVRADRAAPGTYDLAPPRQLDNGSWEFETVVSTPGVNRYPYLGTVEYVDPSAISSEAYTSALRGLPLIDDPDLHWPGVTPAEIERARVGTVLDARWDDAQQATIARIVVDVPRGIDAIRDRSAAGVSLHYTPDVEPADAAPDGTPITHRQTGRRKLNHLLLTPSPNDAAARIRADEASMTPDEIKALIHESVGERFAALEARMDAMKPKADEAMTPEQIAAKAKADEDAAAALAAAEPRADEWRQVLAVAAASKVTIPANATITEARKAVVKAALPQRADSDAPAALAGIVAGLHAGISAAPVDDVWTRIANGGTVRADAAGDDLAALLTHGA